jgi:hypothetical protein
MLLRLLPLPPPPLQHRQIHPSNTLLRFSPLQKEKV